MTLLFEGELHENFAVKKGRDRPHQPARWAQNNGRVTDVLHLHGNDEVIVDSIPFLSNICAQTPIAEKKNRKKIISLILVLYYFCPFPEAAPEESQFYRWLLSISGYTKQQSAK